MAVQKPSIPKGTRDFSPEQVAKRKYILSTIEKVFIKYGFMPIETPTMENLSTLEGKYGDEGDKLLFRILDSGEYFDNVKKIEEINIDSDVRKAIFEFLKEAFITITAKIYLYKDENIEEGIFQEFYYFNKFFFETEEHKKYVGLRFYFHNNGKSWSNVIYKYFLEKEPQEIFKDVLVDSEKFANEQVSNIETYQNGFNQMDLIKWYLIGTQKVTKEISEKGLRYDLTVPFARYVVMHQNEITFPFKRYQMQPVWRADRPQKGRYREFWQCDADVVGSDSLLNELDLIQIYDEAFRELKIENYELRINNRKILAGIAEVVKGVEHMNTIAVAIDKLDKIGEEGVGKELSQSGFSENEIKKLFEIINIKGSQVSQLFSLKEKIKSSQDGLKGIEELEFILTSLLDSARSDNKQFNESTNQQINLKIDFSLARGLSYYTGCIFEVVSTEGTLKSSIGGGGRYDNLTGIFGLPNVSGVGISFGLDRIYDVMEELNLFPETIKKSNTKILFCCFDSASQQYALSCLKKLRDANIPAEIYPDIKKVGKQLDYANALQIPFACIIGENEMQTGKLVLKNLHSGTQQELSIEAIIQTLFS